MVYGAPDGDYCILATAQREILSPTGELPDGLDYRNIISLNVPDSRRVGVVWVKRAEAQTVEKDALLGVVVQNDV